MKKNGLIFLCFFLIFVIPGNIEVKKIELKEMDISYVNSSNGLPMIGQWPYATGIGDINEDGYLDIIRLRGHDDFEPEDQGFQIWLGDGKGNWTKTNIPNGNFGYGGTAVGDFNNDGYLDAAYGVHHNRSHPLVGAWAGNGGINFTEYSDGLATDGETYGMAPIDFGDFNNDGWLDIGVGSFGGENGIRAYQNINGVSWVSKSNGLPHSDVMPNVGDWLIWADINRDGNLDIIINTEIAATDEEHLIWLGDGKGNWTANDFGLEPVYLFGSYGLDVGDINNDGWLDIAFIEHIQNGWYVPVVYAFNGSGWRKASNGLPNSSNYPEVTFAPLAFGDLNNDDNLDLVALEEYVTGEWPYYEEWTAIHAWLGDGEGNWTEIEEIDSDIPGEPQSVTLADIDHNNYLDIIITSSKGDYAAGGIRVYRNTKPASELNITIRQPIGGEVFVGYGIRTIKWTSSIPNGIAKITLQYSIDGKASWHNIVENITDSNYYQWTVPNVNTTDAYIRTIIYWNNQSCFSTNPRPFTIIGGIDKTPPSIKNISVKPHVQLADKPVNISCNVIDNAGVEEVKLIIENPNAEIMNVSMCSTGNLYYYNSTYSTIGNYSFKIWAKDINGNEAISDEFYFKIIGLEYPRFKTRSLPLECPMASNTVEKNPMASFSYPEARKRAANFVSPFPCPTMAANFRPQNWSFP